MEAAREDHLPLCWAAQRTRSSCDTRTAEQKAIAARAAAKPRQGGQFRKAGVKTVLPVRSQAERAKKDKENFRKV
jgi:hypothetical protein